MHTVDIDIYNRGGIRRDLYGAITKLVLSDVGDDIISWTTKCLSARSSAQVVLGKLAGKWH